MRRKVHEKHSVYLRRGRTWPTGGAGIRRSELTPWNFFAGNAMEPQPDFKELFALFNDHRVEYIILGLDQYIQNKRALGRKKDLADLEALGKE